MKRDGLSGPIPNTGYLLNKTAAAIHTMASEALAPLGIAPRDLGVLLAIAGAGPLSQKDVGELRRIDRTTMVEIIDRMERLGLVRRSPDPADRRCHLLSLTERGGEVAQSGLEIGCAVEDRFLRPLGGEDRAHLRRILTMLYDQKDGEQP